MIQIKQNVSVRAPVRLISSSGTPVTGVVAAGITSATAYYADGSSAVITATGNWFETAQGGYQLVFTPTVLGPVQLVVVPVAAVVFLGVFDCVSSLIADLVTGVNGAQTAALSTLNALTGGWVLDTTLNQLTIYSTDNVTVLAKFNCFDSSGLPSVTNVFKRTRI